MLQKNTSDATNISIEEEKLLNKDFDVAKILGANPQYGIEILEQHFHILYKKFISIIRLLQKYAYEEVHVRTAIPGRGKEKLTSTKKLTIENIQELFGLQSGNFKFFTVNGSNPFLPNIISSHVEDIIDTTQNCSTHIITDKAKNDITDITNQLIATGESLTTLITHYNRLRLLPIVGDNIEEAIRTDGPLLESTPLKPEADVGHRVGKTPTLEKYDKKRDYYDNTDPATLPTHFHVSDEMLDVTHYKNDHQEN